MKRLWNWIIQLFATKEIINQPAESTVALGEPKKQKRYSGPKQKKIYSQGRIWLRGRLSIEELVKKTKLTPTEKNRLERLKNQRSGRTVWSSRQRGTYIEKFHFDLLNSAREIPKASPFAKTV